MLVKSVAEVSVLPRPVIRRRNVPRSMTAAAVEWLTLAALVWPQMVGCCGDRHRTWYSDCDLFHAEEPSGSHDGSRARELTYLRPSAAR